MNEYGIKIKNIEASTLYEHNIGVREHYEFKQQMFVNSLFNDFLLQNGMIVNGESTKDIICLEFNYGQRSYHKEMDHLNNILKKCYQEHRIAYSKNDTHLIIKTRMKLDKISSLMEAAIKNKKLYNELSKDELRYEYYNNGCDVPYYTYKRNGEVDSVEVIHYKMLYRSTGKAKKGSCMFIREELYDKAKDFLYMGIQLPDKNAKIVEISAYAPLISSGIVGRVEIDPKNVLILKDVDRYINTDVVSIETDENKHCIAKLLNNYALKNTLFDGQALIDESIFPEWGNGFVLLRQHFFKAAAFCTRIQLFFKDYFGDDYETAEVVDMFGNVHKAKDIKLITTDNQTKWLKFGISYDYWCEKVNACDNLFGIVKTAHESKLGNTQKMSYQMVNSLDINTMDEVMDTTQQYVNLLARDNNAFFDYLERNVNYANDFEVLLFLCKNNPEFFRSEYFRERKNTILKSLVLSLKSGKILNNADNMTIVGSPYAMLTYAVTGVDADADNDKTFSQEDNSIQCYTERFEDGEYLAGFRSPFNARANLTSLHNVYNDVYKKYFSFGQNVIAVNMIGTCFQARNNGLTYWASVQECA